MYHAKHNGTAHTAERLQWVRKQSNGVYVLCDEAEGQGVVLDGEIYHVSGREQIGKPTVHLCWQDDVKTATEGVSALAALTVDLAYQQALMEIGGGDLL